MSSLIFLLLSLASCGRFSSGVILQRNNTSDGELPAFMKAFYQFFLTGKPSRSSIIHSNSATDVKRSDIAFEATFRDLRFLQNETLKRAKLRLELPHLGQCSLPELKIVLSDNKTGRILGEYVMSPQNTLVTSLILTKSVQKLASSLNPDKRLNVRVTLRNPKLGKKNCFNAVNSQSSRVYLITNTENMRSRKRRSSDGMPRISRWKAGATSKFHSSSAEESMKVFGRARKDISDLVQSSAKEIRNQRWKRTATCSMKQVYVNLTSTSGSIVLPSGFTTGVCGPQHPVPLSLKPMVQQLASAIAAAIQQLPSSNNPSCCMPSAFKQLPVLYINNRSHTVLRYVDNVVVTKCACANNT